MEQWDGGLDELETPSSTSQLAPAQLPLPLLRVQRTLANMGERWGGACSEIARELNGIVHERALNEVGRLEQEVVFNDAKGKDLIKLFGEKAGLATQDKVRTAASASTPVASHALQR